MKQLYIIFMLTTSAHLFGAAAAGNTPQERFNNALQEGNVNVIVATFVDLPREDRRETTENYKQFARFMRSNLPDIESTAYQGIIAFYQNNQHPIARWVINGNPDRLDLQLAQFAADDALVQDDVAEFAPEHIRVQDEDTFRAPDPVIQQRLFDDAEEPLDQGFYEPLFHRRSPTPPAQEIPAFRHNETLQSKMYKPLARAYIRGIEPLERIRNELELAGLSWPQFAIEVFFALNEDNAWGHYTMTNYPAELMKYFREHGLSLLDYIAHGVTLSVPADSHFYSVFNSFLTSLDGIALVPGIERINSLYAAHNQLITLSNDLSNLKNLRELSLNNNQLVTLSDSIGNITNLRSIDLKNNQLTTVPANIGNLQYLEELNLSHNQLTRLPASIGNLQHLEELNLSNNQLTTLSANISNLQQLEELNLSNNQLATLPANIGNLQQIRFLYLHDNQLTQLPNTFGNLQYLEQLDLRNNQLTTLPDSIGNLVNLERLELSGNQFSPEERKRITQLVHDATDGECRIIW